tara:strand:- start:358 stop:597 length:240 start_codon:yes stop_codon:yes gene_type:complete
MGFLKPPKPPAPPPLPPVKPAPPPPPPVPEEIEPEVKEDIAKEQAAVERRRRGRKSTILTSPLGIQESEEEKLETLLGK